MGCMQATGGWYYLITGASARLGHGDRLALCATDDQAVVTVEYTSSAAPAVDNQEQCPQPVVLILVGVPGAGE
jgi:hypothetical protein